MQKPVEPIITPGTPGTTTTSPSAKSVSDFLAKAKSALEHKPKPPSGFIMTTANLIDNFATLGHSPIETRYRSELEGYTHRISDLVKKGTSLTGDFSTQTHDLTTQHETDLAQRQKEAQEQTRKIQQETLEEYERNLYNGQTIGEIMEGRRTREANIIREADRQQRAALMRENLASQQQLEMQGRQQNLEATTIIGGRGLGGSSIGSQMLAQQQSQTDSRIAQSNNQLAQGISQIRQTTSQQISNSQKEILQQEESDTKRAQSGLVEKKAQASEGVIQGLTQETQKLQNAYEQKRNELDKLTQQVNNQVQRLMESLQGG